ncbi:hypothetical protein [Metabacillus indicus]|uniref:hypothetical protein n=1 Tax=Metabacillus indicus TaxID=246786 RepID=UPI002491502E|nr:hypothetical protein [Metabacillus indicus]
MRVWATKIDALDMAELLPPSANAVEQEDVQMERLREFIEISPPAVLNSVEQFMIAPFVVYEGLNFAYQFSSLDTYKIGNVLELAPNFYKILKISSNRQTATIQLSEAKKESIELLKVMAEQDQVDSFVKCVYFSPSPYTEKISVYELSNNAAKTSFFELNTENIVPLTEGELERHKDIITFFTNAFPDSYIFKPNKFIVEPDLLDNISIKVFANVYSKLFCCAQDESGTILYIDGAYPKLNKSN